MSESIPVVLFTYNRPGHLERTLAALRANRVPCLLAFSDGPRGEADAPAVAAVRALLRRVDWCELRIVERSANLGLGRSIITGVTEAFAAYSAILVWEDDLVAVPGAYAYLQTALQHYRDEPRVLSVTGWTHPRATPRSAAGQPYLDGRAECWVWGAWRRAWMGMDRTAAEQLADYAARGGDVYRYGADLPAMARSEQTRNIWAVRWLYRHMAASGLCLRPPQTLVEHIGFDANATNARSPGWLEQPLLPCPPLPERWPEPVENPECPTLWRAIEGGRPSLTRRAVGHARRWLRRILPRGRTFRLRTEPAEERPP